MSEPYFIHGHAIVSADDRIADRHGLMPPALRNDADWRRFQAALDAATVTVLGRLGHEANANAKGRNRIVVSRNVAAFERRDGPWWWNPDGASLGAVLAASAPGGGIVAVTGGKTVFDLFLKSGFDAFHLARARKAIVGEGVSVFSACDRGVTAEEVLANAGMTAGPAEMLDAAADVTLTIWRRPQPVPE